MKRVDGRTFTPSTEWKTLPHGARSRIMRTPDVGMFHVKPEGVRSNTYRLWIDGHRTEQWGVGLHYVMALAESELRRRRNGKT